MSAQMDLPEQLKPAQHLLASALDPPCKQRHHTAMAWESGVIPAGPDARAEHHDVSRVESSYWKAVQVLPHAGAHPVLPSCRQPCRACGVHLPQLETGCGAGGRLKACLCCSLWQLQSHTLSRLPQVP